MALARDRILRASGLSRAPSLALSRHRPAGTATLQRRGILSWLFKGDQQGVNDPGANVPQVSLKSVGDNVIAQDPHGRIRFEFPGRFGSRSWATTRALNVMTGFKPKVERLVVELLPFWNIVLVGQSLLHVKRDVRAKTRFMNNTTFYTSASWTVCAAEEGHWAHGIILCDDIWRLSQFETFDWSSSDIGLYHKHDHTGPQKLLGEMVEHDVAVPFAYGPPNLTLPEQEALAETHPYVFDNLSNGRHSAILHKPYIRFASPTYRMVYRAHLSDGSCGFFDLTHRTNSFRVLPPGDGRVNRREVDRATRLTWFREGVFLPPGDDDEPPGVRAIPIDNMNSYPIIESTIVGAMKRSPIDTPGIWEDPRILPLSNSTDKQNPVDLLSAFSYFIDLCNDKPAKEPSFGGIEEVRPRGRMSSHLLRPARPQPSASKKSTPPKKSSATPNSTRSRVQSRLHPSTEHQESRARLLRDRAEHLLKRQKTWHTAAQAAPTGVKVELDVPRDTKGYYKRLGLVPRPDFLSEAGEKVVNDKIQSKYHKLVIKYHPDRSTTEVEEVEFNKITASINVAYTHIRTLQARLSYHGPTRPKGN